MRTGRASRMVVCGVSVALTLVAVGPATAQTPAGSVTISGAIPDAGEGTITITGEHFGTRPFVTLNLLPLNVQSASDSRIVALAPVEMMPADTYLLTVSPSTVEGESGSFDLTLGEPRPRPASRQAAASDAVQSPSPEDVAAKVGDRIITVGEVDAEWRRTDPGGYLSTTRALYDNRRRVLDQMVSDALLAREAASRSITTQALLADEVPKRVVTMPESAVLSLYQSLGDRTRGASLEQMRPALRAWLTRKTEPELAKMSYVEELKKVSTRADVLLEAPRVHVDSSPDDPALGPAAAPVEIVAFGDFESAEYARYAFAFPRVRDTYGDRVRLVFKHLPVGGPDSQTAAEAAACAAAQGRFWPYHDALLVQTGAFSPSRLKEAAGAVGLDRTQFDACLDGGTYRNLPVRSLEEAERYAVTSSPSFLVNGVLAPTPPPFLPPFEFFTRLIDEALLDQALTARKSR